MDQNAKRTAALNWVVMLGASMGMMVVSRYVSSATAVMATILTGYGLLVALLTYFHLGLLEREQYEKMEMEELSKTRGSESLFTTAGADTFPARRSREQFERFFVPSFTILLFILQAAGAYWPWKKLALMPAIVTERATLGMALMGLMALLLFLLGKYSAGLARLQGVKLLRPGSAYMLLSAYAALAAVVTIALVWGGAPRVDLIVARVLCAISGLAAVETLLSIILEGYRVRVQGRETRLLYDSRLVGLLGQPEAIITTAAQAMDYQFGFKVSETWFYRFLEKAFVWMLLAQLGALVLSSCFIIIEPGNQALLERCGKPVGRDGVIGPGLHLKLPWPIDRTQVFPTERIQTFLVGAEPEKGETIAWATPHAKEENFLVASRELNAAAPTNGPVAGKGPPVSLLSVSIPVQYQITNLAAWAYTNEDPIALLTNVAEREVIRYLASADFDSLMSSGRTAATEALRRDIQGDVDQLGLGTKIAFVGLEDIHPPTKVAKIFDQVVGAAQTKQSTILKAQAYAVSTNNWAIGESAKRVLASKAQQHGAITNAAARAILFAGQKLAYSAAPGQNGKMGIYQQRAYLEALVEKSKEDRKYIIATTNAPIIPIIDLQDKVRSDLNLIDRLPTPSAK
jgi:regulator of protease activity HflC (stomatin/prohibitin superfamily)